MLKRARFDAFQWDFLISKVFINIFYSNASNESRKLSCSSFVPIADSQPIYMAHTGCPQIIGLHQTMVDHLGGKSAHSF